MVVTRSRARASKGRSFILTWSGTSRGQGQYEFEYMSKNRRPVYSHVKNKQYVIWCYKTEWIFGKRSELNKRDPAMFAWCADQGRTPLDIRSNWKILDSSNMQWVDCSEFTITSVPTNAETKEESSDAEKDYYSYKMSPDEEARVSREIEILKQEVNRNALEIKNFKSNIGGIEDPRNKSDLISLEKRLYKLEIEELERTSKLVQRVEAAYSTVQKICKQSKHSLKKEELAVLSKFDLLKYTTMRQLKEFLREKRNKEYFIRGYGYIKLTGKKATLAKRVKRVLDQMEQDGGLVRCSTVKPSGNTEEKDSEFVVSPRRKSRKISSRGRS